MKKQTAYKQSERGVALVFALLSILVLSILALAIMTTSQSQIWTSLNYRLTAQARYAAEAGVQETMSWLSSASYTVPSVADQTHYNMNANPVTLTSNNQPVVLSSVTTNSNYYDSTSTVVSGFAGAAQGTLPNESNVSYSTTAKLLRMSPASGASWLPGTGGVVQTWQITSVATISGPRSGSVQVVETFERTTEPVFQYGLEALGTGCGAIDLAGGDFTDSYNSTTGIYSSQVPGNGGSIATNGNVNLGKTGGLAVVKGNIGTPNPTVGACPANGVTDAGAGNYGKVTSINKMTAPLPWGCKSMPCYPPGTNITTPQDVSKNCATIAGCKTGTPSCSTCTTISISPYGESTVTAKVYTLAPGSYGNLAIDNSDVVHLTAGTYNVNSVNFGSIAQNFNGQFVLDSGPVVFNLVGNCGGGGCPSYTEPAGYLPTGWANPQTAVIYGAGFAGFNVCALGVVALKPGDATHTFCGTSTTQGVTAIPANFQLVYGGTDLIRVGGMPNAAVTYAPAASYISPGGAVGYYGSIIASQFADTAASPFHYDTAEQNAILQMGPLRPVGGFSWSKF